MELHPVILSELRISFAFRRPFRFNWKVKEKGRRSRETYNIHLWLQSNSTVSKPRKSQKISKFEFVQPTTIDPICSGANIMRVIFGQKNNEKLNGIVQCRSMKEKKRTVPRWCSTDASATESAQPAEDSPGSPEDGLGSWYHWRQLVKEDTNQKGIDDCGDVAFHDIEAIESGHR